MDGDDRVLAIVLATQHLLGLAGVNLTRQIVQRAPEVLGDRLTGLGPFDENRQVLDTSPQPVAEVAIFFEAAAALKKLLRGGLVFPEIRLGYACFDFGEFVGGFGGVKDSSAGPWRVAPDPRACEAVRPVEGP
jgi:hypothetical protein